MILYHPLSKSANTKAISTYKDRLVFVYSKRLDMWLTSYFESNHFGLIKDRIKIPFKTALKITKHYHENDIEYHFIHNSEL